MVVDRLQKVISDLITIRHTEAAAREGRKLSALQIIFSLIFGILAIPAFATGVIKPMWNWLTTRSPQDAAEVWFFIIAFFIVEVPIFLVTRSILRKRS
jgi:hypothetical protein